MKVVSLAEVKKTKNLILTIGCFDGLHRGHQKIIRVVVSEAKKKGEMSAVLTFNRHPRSLTKNIQIPFLITPKEKFKLLDEWGHDLCILANFNQSFANLSAQAFCEEILKKRLGIREVVTSSSFRFGKDRTGDIELLKKQDISVKVIKPLKVKDEVVSSTLIRNLIKQAKLKEAVIFLGRDFSVLGKVIPGEKRGRVLGYPTANLKVVYPLNLPGGVYAVRAEVNGKEYNGLSNIGFRPTFNGSAEHPTMEVHLFNFAGDLYNQKIRIVFKKKIRNEIDFSKNKSLLLKQIRKDKEKAKKILATADTRRCHSEALAEESLFSKKYGIATSAQRVDSQ